MRRYGMKKPIKKRMLLSLAGLALVAMADNASAQVVINGTGSSAGRQFAGDAPIAMCINENVGAGTPKPVHLRSSTTDSGSNQHTWVCNVTYTLTGASFTNQPAVIRYSATESGDGFTRLTGQYATALTAAFITASTCGTSHEVTASNGLVFDEY